MPLPHLLVFGPGFSARPIMARAKAEGWRVTASFRRTEVAENLRLSGYETLDLTQDKLALPKDVTHILTSIAPARDGSSTDPILDPFGADLAGLKTVQWIGYLSATNVYGDHGGAWVDETTPPEPTLARGRRRVEAEDAWANFSQSLGATHHIFRLAGIYGPGRNTVKSLLNGTARRIVKDGQIFSRIHVADIAAAVWAAMTHTDVESGIYNLADDAPLPPDEAVRLAAEALGIAPPPAIPFEDAEMSAMARSFYSESKRVRNDKVKTLPGFAFRYPTLESALSDLVEYEKNTSDIDG